MNKPYFPRSETIRSFFFWVTTLIMFVQSSNSANGFRHVSYAWTDKEYTYSLSPGQKKSFWTLNMAWNLCKE